MGVFKRVIYSIIASVSLFFLFSNPIVSYAAERAYLYFYTVDGEEIEELTKRVSQKNEYTFKDPDSYKYLPAEDGDEKVYPELYYQVTGIHWEEKDGDGNAVKTYAEGDVFDWSAGDHYFYVKTDNPNLTGENVMDLNYDEQAHLYFCNVDGSEIYSLQQNLSTKDDFTFPDPADYAYWFESGEGEEGEYIESDEFSGQGTHWYCKDDNDREYLFKEGDKCNFREGEYYFYPRTDDPVTVNFYYPFDYGNEFVTDDCPGDLYATVETKVGESIQLKRSLGALIWENTFQGWDEVNFGDGEIFPGGSSFKVVNNADLDFYAIYEYDENWNPDAIDENKSADELNQEKTEEELIVDIDKINEAAGAGYGAYVDSSGKLQKNKTKVNGSVNLYGIPGTIKKDTSLSPLKPGVDKSDPDSYKDPENYAKDKYGNDMEDSKLEPEINNVLRQDDSALYMDVYGNAFVYYSQLSREANMKLALERLTLGKTDSWVKNVQNWDTEVINRFEAIEFALLSGVYPEDGQELAGGVAWKNSYMSKKAFSQLANYKKLWNGWLDSYDDGLFEKYQEQGGTDGGATVGKFEFKNPFSITAYAATKPEKNPAGKVGQIGSRFNVSNDVDDVKFKPQYYDPTKVYGFSSYAFSGLNGLTSEQVQNLSQIFNALVNFGFSEEMAAGACGNLWQESNFNPNIKSGAGYLGIVQWGGGRADKLKALAESQGKEWSDLSAQIDYMKRELEASYLTQMNRYLTNNTAYSNAKSLKDVTTACEAWCVAMEGCTCVNGGVTHSGHNAKCAVASNGKSYQHLKSRMEYAQRVYNAMTKSSGFIGGSFAGMTNKEIISQIFPGATGMNNLAAAGYTESKIKKDYIVSVKSPGGRSVAGGLNKYIADDMVSILGELEAMGFPLNQMEGFNYRKIANSSSLSFHSSGLAIDINPSGGGNPVLTFGTYKNDQARILKNLETGNTDQGGSYAPKTDKRALRVAHANVFRKYGLLWGRDFSTKADMMHFSLGEVTMDGCNAFISNYFEQ